MKQWLNTPVTYGCVIRVLLIGIFGFSLLAAGIDWAFNIGGPHWTTVSTAILAVLAIIVAPIGYILVFLSPDKDTHPDPSSYESINAHMITSEQAFELLQKQEETALKANSNQETGTLIVSASRDNRGTTVYLLPRDEFLKYKIGKERESSKQKRIGTITRRRYGLTPIYVTCFRDLRPGRYNVWIDWGKDNPESRIVQIEKSTVSELELDWRN